MKKLPRGGPCSIDPQCSRSSSRPEPLEERPPPASRPGVVEAGARAGDGPRHHVPQVPTRPDHAPPPTAATPAPAPATPQTAAPKPAALGARTKVAVMEVAGVQGVAPGTATILTNIVVADVARTGLDTVSKGDITAIIGFEKQKQILGCAQDANCIAEIGGALGVEFMLTGQVGQIGSQYHLSLQLVETRKAKVAARASRFSEKNEDALVMATREAAAEVLVPALARNAAATGAKPQAAVATKAAPNRRPAWIALGTAGVLAVAGGVTGYVAKAKYDDLKAQEGTPGYGAKYAAEKGSIESTALAADIMFGGAIVAAGVGTWLWFRADKTVAVVPVVARGGAMLAVASTF